MGYRLKNNGEYSEEVIRAYPIETALQIVGENGKVSKSIYYPKKQSDLMNLND